MEGKEPTLKDKALQRELEKHHMRLETQCVTQNPAKSRNKNSGRQVLPNTPTNNRTGEKTMSEPTAQTSGNNAPAPGPTPSPADRMQAQLESIAAGLKPDPLWVTGVKAGVGVVVITAGVTAGVCLAGLIMSPAAPAKKL